MPRVYYASELAAHDAARELSKTTACGLFVDEDHSGFFVTPLGRIGSTPYFGGELLSDEPEHEIDLEPSEDCDRV